MAPFYTGIKEKVEREVRIEDYGMSVIGSDTRYTIELDQTTKAEWSDWIRCFGDANIYQTWSYGAVHWGERNLSHLLLKKKNEVVAMAQARIVKFPGMDTGIAYIFRGPLWRLREREADFNTLGQMINALRKIYVSERHLWLRILPNEVDHGDPALPDLFRGEGFKWREGIIGNRTLLIDLSFTLDDLRSGMRKGWRETLRNAEKRPLKLIEGTSGELYDLALAIYQEMHARKGFVEFFNMNQYRAIQQGSPDPLKIVILICMLEGKPISALAWSALGYTGLPILSATGNEALKTNASYLMWWKMIEWLKLRGFRWCDMGGIDPVSNPGGYRFKSGLSGKCGKDIQYYGQFDACESWLSSFLISGGDQLRFAERKGRTIFNRLRKKLHTNNRGMSKNEKDSVC